MDPGRQDEAMLPDAQAAHPIWRYAPQTARPYVQLARLDRPIGWWLLLLPCWEGSLLASSAEHMAPNYFHLFLFFIGAIVMRGAGSTYNDYVDRQIDAKVERTKKRPLACGAIKPQSALIFMMLQCFIGLSVLLFFNPLTIALAMISPFIVLIYPYAKRVTSWPQAILGLAFASGALLGWTAETNTLAPAALSLYLSGILWTIGYDTIYALQDVRDDIAIGVQSTARLFGKNVRMAVGLLYASASVFAAIAALLSGAGLFTLVGIGGFSLHLIWQTYHTGEEISAQKALSLFRSNRDAGLLLCSGLFIQSIINSL
ncbi:MAG: 4-hydroxybenzoate octaprenyltransferase [Methylocystis sp.]|nr:4-hydroxybenzoate octaprenyltransferase [Alphaproteobacteria bacterium]